MKVNMLFHRLLAFVFLSLAVFIPLSSFAEEPFSVFHPEFTTPSGAKIKTTLLVPK